MVLFVGFGAGWVGGQRRKFVEESYRAVKGYRWRAWWRWSSSTWKNQLYPQYYY